MNKKLLLNVIITGIIILLCSGIVGGGVYYWQSTILRQKEALLQQRIDELEENNIDLTRQIEELEQGNSDLDRQINELKQTTCQGTWKNGECVLQTCGDSDGSEKPDDIFIKGSVTFTDKNGLVTTLYDECNGSNTQVSERWCYENPQGSGNYVPGTMVYNCSLGCFDGACLTK